MQWGKGKKEKGIQIQKINKTEFLDDITIM